MELKAIDFKKVFKWAIKVGGMEKIQKSGGLSDSDMSEIIKPFPGKIFIKPDKTDMGAFEQVDSRVSESGTITHIGGLKKDMEGYEFPDGTPLRGGDKVYFKAWGMDAVEIEGVKYFVADVDRHNLLCKIIPSNN